MIYPAAPEADGYTTEIPYLAGYYRELNPSIQLLALNRRGFAPWQRGAAMTYLELGCGYGLSTLIHAAANPQATFIAIDMLPEHIMSARGLAESARLKNVTFIEGQFAALKDMDLPACDFITLHGVWTWINETNRKYIAQCVNDRLKPGGVLYLSYNALPGCAGALPLRYLMRAGFDAAKGDLPQRIESAVAFADAVKSVGGGYFADNPLAAHRFDDLKGHPRQYIAHEYFNADWRAFYHAEVVDDLRGLDLTYVTQAQLFETLDDMHFSGAALAQIQNARDAVTAETLRDFFANRQFRTDIFVRNPAPPADHTKTLRATRFAPLARPGNLERFNRRTTLGEIAPPQALTNAILTALADRAATMDELAANPALQGLDPGKLPNIMYALAALGVIDVAMPEENNAAREAAARRLNTALREKNCRAAWSEAQVSAITGGGVEVVREDQIFFLAQERDNPIAFAARNLGESEDDVRPRYEAFLNARLPIYRKFGIS